MPEGTGGDRHRVQVPRVKLHRGRWAGGAVRRHQIFPTATPHHPTVPRRLPEAVLVVSAQMKAHAQVWCGLGAGWCRLVQVGGHPWVHAVGGDRP